MAPSDPPSSSSTLEYIQLLRELGILSTGSGTGGSENHTGSGQVANGPRYGPGRDVPVTSSPSPHVLQTRIEHVLVVSGVEGNTLDGILRQGTAMGLAMGRHLVQSVRIVTYGLTFALVAWGTSRLIHALRADPIRTTDRGDERRRNSENKGDEDGVPEVSVLAAAATAGSLNT